MSITLTYADRLGRVIAIRRAELRMGRKDLAEDAAISYPYLSEIEKGVKEPSHKVLVRIGDALGLTTAQLEVAALALDPYGEPSVLIKASAWLVPAGVPDDFDIVMEDQ